MRRETLLFLLLAFAYSWVMASVLYVFHLPSSALLVVSTAYMFGPALAILTLKLLRYPIPDLGLRFNPNGWWVAAWFLPPFMVLLTFLADLLIPGVKFSPNGEALMYRLSRLVSPQDMGSVKEALGTLTAPMLVSIFLYGMVAGITVNALVALGEEVGWRGFLYSEMRRNGFWKMSYTVGVIWGIWHAPIILKGHNYPVHPVAGVFMMVLFTTLISPLLFFVRERAESTLAAAIFHGTVNAVAGFDLLFLSGGSDLTVGLTGLSGLIVLALLNLLLYIFRKRYA